MLLGKHMLATVWLYCRNVQKSLEFYRDVLGLPCFDEHSGTAHFDAGGTRLSLHPADEDNLPPRGSFLVFAIQANIDTVYADLERRGVRFNGQLEDKAFGRVASFCDPDGHMLFIWQPPPPNDSRYAIVAPLVHHYESLSRCILGKL